VEKRRILEDAVRLRPEDVEALRSSLDDRERAMREWRRIIRDQRRKGGILKQLGDFRRDRRSPVDAFLGSARTRDALRRASRHLEPREPSLLDPAQVAYTAPVIWAVPPITLMVSQPADVDDDGYFDILRQGFADLIAAM
jgi:hypothetical protein